jgi:hypothetical protein
MMRFRPNRPSPALVVSEIALIIALGGRGYAAIRLAANSVGNKQLKTGGVLTKKIARNLVTNSKVKRNSLTGADIRTNNANLAGEAGL